MLFNFEWFDFVHNRGTGSISHMGLLKSSWIEDILKLFIYLSTSSHSTIISKVSKKIDKKSEWAIVVNIKPRARVEVQNSLELARRD